MEKTNFFRHKKVLVTGGAGFIGSHLVKRLVREGAIVTVIDDFSRGTEENLKEIMEKIIVIKADLRSEANNQQYFEKQEIIFNLAALNTGVDYDLGRTEVMFEDNMLLQMVPLRLASRAKTVKRFVQISSASVYSRFAMENEVPTPENADTTNPEPSKLGYALAKKMGENLAVWYNQNTHLETVSARFINVFGENDNSDEKGHFIPVMIRKFIEADSEVEVFGSGNQKRSFIYVEDAVESLLLLAEKGVAGEAYNVDTNNEKSVKEVVEEINNFFPEKKLKIVYNTAKPEGSQRRMLDSSKLRKLGWSSQTPFSLALERTVQDLKKKLHA